jgi:hypothetical protein
VDHTSSTRGEFGQFRLDGAALNLSPTEPLPQRQSARPRFRFLLLVRQLLPPLGKARELLAYWTRAKGVGFGRHMMPRERARALSRRGTRTISELANDYAVTFAPFLQAAVREVATTSGQLAHAGSMCWEMGCSKRQESGGPLLRAGASLPCTRDFRRRRTAIDGPEVRFLPYSGRMEESFRLPLCASTGHHGLSA